MKKILSYFIIVLFLFCVYQCQKDEKRTIVEVTALDKTTNQVIPDARVILIADTFSTFMGPSYYAVVEEKYTDIAGKCHFDFIAKKSWTYYFVASAEHYYDLGDPMGDIDNGKMNYVAIPFQPEAFLKVYVKNTQPYDIYDYISVNPFGTPGGGGGVYTGISVDTFSVARLWGNNTRDLNYWVKKNGIENHFTTSIYCSAFDTTVYTINY